MLSIGRAKDRLGSSLLVPAIDIFDFQDSQGIATPLLHQADPLPFTDTVSFRDIKDYGDCPSHPRAQLVVLDDGCKILRTDETLQGTKYAMSDIPYIAGDT